MMRLILGLALAVFLVASAPVLAVSSPPGCTGRNAATTTIVAIQADYPAWRGKCVRVRGIAVGAHLYADRMAFLEPRGAYGKALRRSLFLNTGSPRLPWQRPSAVEAIGRVGSCNDENEAVAAVQAQEPENIIMVAGYCHTSLETYVRTSSVRVLSTAPIQRLTEAEVPPAERQLVAAPADVTGYREQVGAARRVIGAVATGDLESFQFLDFPETLEESGVAFADARRNSRAVFRRLSTSRALFAALDRAGPERMRVFVDREDLENLRRDPEGEVSLVTCWCKAASCNRRWPVLRADTDNAPERPYLCVATGEYVVFRNGTRIQAQLDVARGGFAEPRSGVARR